MFDEKQLDFTACVSEKDPRQDEKAQRSIPAPSRQCKMNQVVWGGQEWRGACVTASN